MADVPATVLADLNAGHIETRTLVEMFAMDLGVLLDHVAPGLGPRLETRAGADAGITRRMAAAADVLLEAKGPAIIDTLAAHPSDMARGWGAYAVGALDDLDLPARLARIRPFAADPHFGVREWAWLGVRARIAADVDRAIALLEPWTGEARDTLRRFAVESTRPRGVWCRHIAALKADPGRGLPVLAPLRADPSPYVQDSVANWLNDAARGDPAWVRALCASWLGGVGDDAVDPATRRICRRAQRSLKDA
ncbi:DNA alkylation repair protein [Roseospira visakhapatnamensis]|uniref:3-methyladenine DNA glycosylase AlkC n=1 Tax=Roseospira visakhapatnamensis TaxID=390880 RepID=A0A7W6RBA6_9PROT|nr:DNA alkylation repair protein [Roseospira visakhapatnamensis]MBB4264764.1 3-methyladenine DNA glycosylase AlkC [Roseospira visakhapatnamensis]